MPVDRQHLLVHRHLCPEYRNESRMHFDSRFVKKCQSGDRVAQRQLFAQLYAPLHQVSFRYIGQRAETGDCLMHGFGQAIG